MAYTMTQTEYAKHRGIRQSRISTLISEGKLNGAIKIPKGKKKPRIDSKKADLLLNDALDRRFKKNPKESRFDPFKPLSREDAERVVQLKKAGKYEYSYNKVRTDRENIKLQLDILELQKQKKEVYNKNDIDCHADLIARAVKNNLTSLKDRISAIVAPITDEHEVKEIITTEVEYTLKAISEELKAYA